jgi:carboxynorspermidine decarboxylase
VIDLGLLRDNVRVLERIQREADCKILLALKGFATWSTFPAIRDSLAGITASSLHEAELGRRRFGKEVHAYAPAYSEQDIWGLSRVVDHLIFNSVRQFETLSPLARRLNPQIELGIRVNPEHSEAPVPMYDPCAAGSRLGVLAETLKAAPDLALDGLHFHTLCEQGVDALERTLGAFEDSFSAFIPKVKWVNFGGGHLITRPGYEVERLINLIKDFKARHSTKARKLQVYLEPGSAIALNTGFLVTSVLDVVHNLQDIAILDTSASAHMPDVLEMPYRPEILGAKEPGALPHTYRLGGLTCLAGDVVGDYSFEAPLDVGSRLVFKDMAHYTMVKTTTFNGVRLPSIVTYDPVTDELKVQRRFGYEDYEARLS